MTGRIGFLCLERCNNIWGLFSKSLFVDNQHHKRNVENIYLIKLHLQFLPGYNLLQ